MPLFGVEIPPNVVQFNVLALTGATGRPPVVYTGTPETTEAGLTVGLAKNDVFRQFCRENGLYDRAKKAAILQLQFEFFDSADVVVGKVRTPNAVMIPFRSAKKKVGLDEATANMVGSVAIAQKASSDNQHGHTLDTMTKLLDGQREFLNKAGDILGQLGQQVQSLTTIAQTSIQVSAESARRAEMREENRTDLLLLDLKHRLDTVQAALDKTNPMLTPPQVAAPATGIEGLLDTGDKLLTMGVKYKQLMNEADERDAKKSS